MRGHGYKHRLKPYKQKHIKPSQDYPAIQALLIF